jgi:hypothetical protein
LSLVPQILHLNPNEGPAMALTKADIIEQMTAQLGLTKNMIF